MSSPLQIGSEPAARRRVFSLAIELTAICNQKCDYCYNAWREDGGRGVKGGESGILMRRIAKLLDGWELDHVTLTGGRWLTRACSTCSTSCESAGCQRK